MKSMSILEFLGIVKQKGVLEASPTTPLSKAVELMTNNNARSLILTDDDHQQPVGLLTMTLAAKELAKLEGASTITAAQAMVRLNDKDFIDPETSWLESAKILAESNKTHLLIGKKGEHLQAVFTATDVLRWVVSKFAKWLARWFWGE